MRIRNIKAFDILELTRKIIIRGSALKLSDRVRDLVQGWLVSKDAEQQKDEVLKEVFQKDLQSNSVPSEKARASLKELWQRMGLPESKLPTAEKLKKALKAEKLVRRNRRLWMSAAAVVFLLLGAGWMWYADRYRPIVFSTGEFAQEIILPDSSHVMVEPYSSLTYDRDFLAGRTVTLEGEAFFSVEADRSNVFSVNADELVVRVYGTDFRVNSRTGIVDYDVSLYKGKMGVVVDGREHELDYGYQMEVNRETHEVKVHHIPLQEMLDGNYKPRLLFNQEPLHIVFQAFEAYYGVSFEISEGVDQSKAMIYSDLDGLPLESALKMVRDANESFDYEIDEMKIIITNKNN